MNKTELLTLFCDFSFLEDKEFAAEDNPFEKPCRQLYSKVADYHTINAELHTITKHYFSKEITWEWKYLLAKYYIFNHIGTILTSSNFSELLSIKEVKSTKTAVNTLMKLGVNTKMLPKIPCYATPIFGKTKKEDEFVDYNILKCSLVAFCHFLKNIHLKALLLPDYLRSILSGLYQIAYCPLNKTLLETTSKEIYETLLNDKKLAVNLLNSLSHSACYVKETMSIPLNTAPPWFRKQVSQTLTGILVAPKGVERITVAMMMEGNTEEWKVLDVVFKLVLSCKDREDFKDNLCRQIVRYLDSENRNEHLFVLCTKRLYYIDAELSRGIFVKRALQGLLYLTIQGEGFKDGSYTDQIMQSIRLVHAIFVEKNADSPCLPLALLKPVLEVVFRVYQCCLETIFKTTCAEAKAVLVEYLKQTDEDILVFDSLMFGNCDAQNDILPFRKNLVLTVEGSEILLKTIIEQQNYCASLESLLNNNTELSVKYFKYLITCIVSRKKLFQTTNEQQLNLTSLVVLSDLITLIQKKQVQKHILDNPLEIITFLKDTLDDMVAANVHRTTQFEDDDFKTLFTVMMVLNTLSANYTKKSLSMFRVFKEVLHKIKLETHHKELVDLIEKVEKNIFSYTNKRSEKDKNKSKLDLILGDIGDPLLPVRGHGLMALKKLVEKKDKDVMEKKQYVLTIFQQNLADDDSFIYLTAVDGLATMCTIFTDTVIHTLCDEYADFTRKSDDSHEIRIKLGEVLVRVSKTLGEMAPKYKAVLLNTFLVGTKDDDHLVRASSLVNLGEICRVLSYKLGTVVTEVLTCVDAIIITDKAPECRRAAVTVIRQLLTGLEKEMIAFLKDDILPVYRTLKQIYENDKDDIMRLQAQLALEELNENMNQFLFPKPQINTDKKIIMLN